MARILVSTASDVGMVREVNEDSFLVDDELDLYIVCDGMGGHAAGEVASRTAASVVREHLSLYAHEQDVDVLVEVMRQAVEEANRRIHELGQIAKERSGMGTTCTALLMRGGAGIVGHVGDSRLYLLREEKLHQLTHDHTFVAEAIRAGIAKKGDPGLAEHSNLVTRAVGPLPHVLVDAFVFDVLPQDSALLCSDGLYEYFEDEIELGRRMAGEDLDAIATGMVASANERGGHDNITAMMLRFEDRNPSKAVGRITATFSTLSHIDLFSELSVPEITQVTRHLHYEDVEAGQVVFRQGDVSEGLWVIMSGTVVVERDAEDVAHLSAGAHFGEMALLNQRPRSATVTALAPSTLLRLSRDAFYDVVQQDHVIGVKFLWKLAQTLSMRLEESFETPAALHEARQTLTYGLFPSPVKD